MKKVKVFSDKKYLLEDAVYEPILYPFWGMPGYNSSLKKGIYPWDKCFQNYVGLSNKFFEEVTIDNADLAIFPTNLIHQQFNPGGISDLVEIFLNDVTIHECPSISFFGGDQSHKKIPLRSDIVFRQSMYDYDRHYNDFAIPAWGEDFVESYLEGNIRARQKSSKPVVGFCGFAARQDLKSVLKHLVYSGQKIVAPKRIPILGKGIGHILRARSIAYLQTSKLVQTNFILKDKPFFNETKSVNQTVSRSAYIQNIIDSDYILCCRGYGNFSFRLYETLSCGRIPVFVNSNCVLPFDFDIDWRQYCVWIEASEISKIAEKIYEFHEKINSQEFVDLQHECRNMWKKRLSPEGFFKHLYLHLDFV